MNDKGLVKRLVLLGVVIEKPMSWHLLDSEGDVIAVFTDERLLVRDWRVAGALMERVADMDAVYAFGGGMDYFCAEAWNDNAFEYHDESLPRVIIEACSE